jgi:hypothetical protein
MSSRKTSNEGDRIATQLDGFRDGKATTYKASEPGISQDYDVAAGQLSSLLSAGDRRWLDLFNGGARPARGSAGNQFGFVTGSQFSDYVGPGHPIGGKFAAMLNPVPGQGIEVWMPVLISADEFQWSARGGLSGMTTDADDGYLLAEDKRNKSYSIAVYERAGLVPAPDVFKAYKDGLIQDDLARPFFSASQEWKLEDAKKRAESAARSKAAQDALKAAQGPAPVRELPSWEITIFEDGNSAFTAKTAAESSAASDAATGAATPHPGVQVAGLDFMAYSNGQSPAQLGLPRALLAQQPDGSITPATEEYSSLRAAAQQGDGYSNAVLNTLGLGFAQQQQQNSGPFSFLLGK